MPCALLLLLALAPQDDDTLAAQAVETFTAAARDSKSEDDLIRAVQTLNLRPHPKILDELIRQLAHPSPRVRGFVVKEFVKYKDSPSAAAALHARLKEELKVAKQDDQAQDVGHEAAVEIFRALAAFPRGKDAAKELLPVFEHVNLSVARGAVAACAELKLLDAVDPLVKLLDKMEKAKAEPPKPNVKGGQTEGFAKLSAADAKLKAAFDRKTYMTSSAQGALKKLLGQNTLSTAKELGDYWAKNKKRLLEEAAKGN
jgi:HEAT repeat protein